MSDWDGNLMAPIEPTKQMVTMSRRQILLIGGIIGLGMSLALAGVVLIAIKVNDFQSEQIRQNDRAIARLKAIEHPSEATQRRRLRAALERCSKDPQCRKLFRETARQNRSARSEHERGAAGTDKGATENPTGGSVQEEPGDGPRGGVNVPRRGQEGGSGGEGSGPSNGAPAPAPSAPSGGGGGGGNGGGQGAAKPLITVPLPALPTNEDLPSVCNPTISVNC